MRLSEDELQQRLLQILSSKRRNLEGIFDWSVVAVVGLLLCAFFAYEAASTVLRVAGAQIAWTAFVHAVLCVVCAFATWSVITVPVLESVQHWLHDRERLASLRKTEGTDRVDQAMKEIRDGT